MTYIIRLKVGEGSEIIDGKEVNKVPVYAYYAGYHRGGHPPGPILVGIGEAYTFETTESAHNVINGDTRLKGAEVIPYGSDVPTFTERRAKEEHEKQDDDTPVVAYESPKVESEPEPFKGEGGESGGFDPVPSSIEFGGGFNPDN